MELMTSTQWKVIALSYLANGPDNRNESKKVNQNDRLTNKDCGNKNEKIHPQEISDCEEKTPDFAVIEIGI